MTQDICCAVPGWLCDVLVAGEELMWRMNCDTTIRPNHGVGHESIYTLMLKGRGGREFGWGRGRVMDVGVVICRMYERVLACITRASYLVLENITSAKALSTPQHTAD